jgi:hypothetical protein
MITLVSVCVCVCNYVFSLSLKGWAVGVTVEHVDRSMVYMYIENVLVDVCLSRILERQTD